jgi:hypothetical protein
MRSIPVLFALTVFSAVAVAAEAPSTKQAAGGMQIVAQAQMPHKGKVLSSIDASIYTYIEVSENGKTVWLAAPTVAVKKGDTIGYDDGAVMTNFFSKSLNRTFETVIFVGRAVVLK